MSHTRRIIAATFCLTSSIGGLYFYTKSKPRRKNFRDLVLVDDFQIHKDIVKNLPEIKKFEVRNNDVYIITFPKSGTTWVQEIVYLISSGLDFVEAESRNLDERSPFLEFPCPGLDVISKLPSPRLIKTHLPLNLLPDEILEKRPRIIYVSRNPRDLVVSYYHFCKKLEFVNFEGNFSDFFREFVDGRVPYGPWLDHVRDYWEMKNDSNVLFITYEDLQSHNHETIKKIAEFLGKSLSDIEIGRIGAHCQFDRMAKNNHANYKWLEDLGLAKSDIPFMRKGKVGDWKGHFTPEMCYEMDKLVQKVEDDELKSVLSTYLINQHET